MGCLKEKCDLKYRRRHKVERRNYYVCDFYCFFFYFYSRLYNTKPLKIGQDIVRAFPYTCIVLILPWKSLRFSLLQNVRPILGSTQSPVQGTRVFCPGGGGARGGGVRATGVY